MEEEEDQSPLIQDPAQGAGVPEHAAGSDGEESLNYDASASSGSESETEGRDDGWALGTVAESDLEGYAVIFQDAWMKEVYEDYVHKNPGTHLHGAVSAEEDMQWQRWWATLVGAPKHQFKLPSGTIENKLL